MKNRKPYLFAIWLLSCSLITSAQKTDYQLTFEPYILKSSKGVEVAAELGKFWVSENRNNAKARKIQLSFVRFKSTSAKPGNPIIYLAGGPGGSGIQSARGPRFDLFMAMREFGDVIAFDQRGTGLSNMLTPCEPPYQLSIEAPGTAQAMVDVVQKNLQHCIASWKSSGADVSGYNNIENADDIEDLRKALGAEKITLWGISYGTQLAFTFVKRHERSVDKLVLAALEATGDNIKHPAYVDNFLLSVEKEITSNSGATQKNQSLTNLMRTVHDKLDREPVIVTIQDRKGNDVKVGISKLDLQLQIAYITIKNPSTLKDLPALYQQMNEGNFQRIAQMIYFLKMYISMPDYYGMGLLMDAITGFSEKQFKMIEQESENAILWRASNFPFPDIIKGLGLQNLGEAYFKDVKSNLPGLFLSGTLDGRTFMEDARRIAGKFKNVKHVILINGGHDMFEQSPGVQELIINYMRGNNIPAQLQLDPVKFATP